MPSLPFFRLDKALTDEPTLLKFLLIESQNMDNLLKNIQRLYGLTANEAYQVICFFQSVNHCEVKTLLQTKVLDQIRQDYFADLGLRLTYNHEGYVNAI